jgi:hypothetical protein
VGVGLTAIGIVGIQVAYLNCNNLN